MPRYPAEVRRYLLAFIGLAAIGAASGIVYNAYATDREYARLIAAGDQADREGRSFQALESYSGAIALRPESMLAHLKRGRLYRERGEFEAAAKDLRRATELDPTATLPLELLGDTFLALGRHERAADRYRAYLAIDDRSAPVWYKLGLALYRDGQTAEAIDALRRAIGFDRQIAEAHLLLGLVLQQQGDADNARRELETAARLSPALTASREALASLYEAHRDFSRAIDQLEALAALDSANPQRFVALGLAHARARRHEAAVLTLSRAVERFPDDPSVYGALGRVWLDAAEARGDTIALRKATQALSTAAAHKDVSSETLTDLGYALMIAGDSAGAERAFSQAIEKQPVHPDAYLHLATLNARRSNYQAARDALVRHAALIGETRPLGAIATRIADYSLRLGDAQGALTWIARAEEEGATPALARLRSRARDGLRTKN